MQYFLNGLLNRDVVVLIDKEYFAGKLLSFDEHTYLIEQDGTEYLVNRRATDMIYLDKGE